MGLPEPYVVPTPVLEIPEAEIPSYTPLYAPPSDLRPPPGVSPPKVKDSPPTAAPRPPSIQQPELPPEVLQIEIPYTDIEVPVPQPEILVTAGTTAVVSVAATLTATSVFKYLVTLMKPIIKTAWTKVTKRKQDSSNSSSLSGQQDS